MADERGNGSPPQRRRDDFRAARIGAIAGLVALIIVLGIQDTLSVDYELQPTTLVTLVIAIFGLAGLEVTDFFRGPPR